MPTKIERNMWFYSIKNVKKNFIELEIDELSDIKIKMFRMDCKFSHSPSTNFDLPIECEKETLYDKTNFFSIKDITTYITKANAETQQKSRRSTIDFNELEQLSEGNGTRDFGRNLLPQDIEQQSEIHTTNYFAQPIPSYGDNMRVETRSLHLDSVDESNNFSFTLFGDSNIRQLNSGHK